MARKKGEGSIYIKKGHYYFRSQVNGKRKSSLLKAKTLKEAENEAKQYSKTTSVIETELDYATFTAKALNIIKFNNAPLLENIFQTFESNKSRPDCCKKTMAQHKKYWNEFTTWLHSQYPNVKNMQDINSDMVNQYFSYIEEVLKGSGYNYRRNTLKLISKTVASDSPNLFASVKKKRTETQIKKNLNEKSFWKIIDVFKDDRFYLAYKNEYEILFYIAAFTGMRLKDCCLLKWDRVNFEHNTIFCIPEKTKKSSGRLVELSLIQDLKNKLIQAQTWRKNEYVLPELTRIYERGYNTVSHETKRIINWALSKDDDLKSTTSSLRKLENQYDYSFHSLRHAFASFCYRNGIPIDKVRDILGHTSSIVTRIYAHADPNDLKKISAAIPSRYGHQKTPEEKLKEIKDLISAKDKLTNNDKKILDIVG